MYNTYIQFHKIPVPVYEPECLEDKDCPSKLACLDQECKNPCTAIQPCAPNAECIVHSTLPKRTMSCVCLPGFTGKGDVHCDKISKIKIYFIMLR